MGSAVEDTSRTDKDSSSWRKERGFTTRSVRVMLGGGEGDEDGTQRGIGEYGASRRWTESGMIAV